MCILCDVRYFLTVHDTAIYLQIFANKKEGEGVWEKKPKNRKEFDKKITTITKELNDAPNMATTYEFLMRVVKSFAKKYDDDLLSIALVYLDILCIMNGRNREPIDKKWIEKMQRKMRKLKFTESEKCYFVINALIHDFNNFHEWFNSGKRSGKEHEKAYINYIG
ncbi:MAG TPA: hypothetical protein ENL42_00590 [Thermoplasmatales archaeon]|nr:hypothetical protein [Thermoplasmatales archaeon]